MMGCTQLHRPWAAAFHGNGAMVTCCMLEGSPVFRPWEAVRTPLHLSVLPAQPRSIRRGACPHAGEGGAGAHRGRGAAAPAGGAAGAGAEPAG